MTPEEVEGILSKYEETSGLNVSADNFTAITNACTMFLTSDELDQYGCPDDVDMEKVNERKKRFIMELVDVYHSISSNDDSQESQDEPPAVCRVKRLIEHVDDQYELLYRWIRMRERNNQPNIVPIPLNFDGSLFRLVTMDKEDDLTPLQKLILYMLDSLQRENYMRYKGQCCQQILTGEEKHETKAWKPIMEVKDFVFEHVQKETKYDMWRNSTAKSANIVDCIKHLERCFDLQFPEIKKDRNIWSFINGIYDGRNDVFYRYGSEMNIDKHTVSSKYFDLVFDESPPDDWYNIETPYFQSILDYQKFPEDVCKWMYVFAGRLCFDMNERDSWQVIPFLKGIAQSGKSTIITKAIKKFYEPEDVKTLSNNIEKKFGLWSIDGCFMFNSPEVKGDLALEQAEFQSIVSGEDISIARKNEKAITKTWIIPGILAGNEVPNWKDNSGSIQRRIVTWNFQKQVVNADPKLDEKLDKEMANILQKCVKAYHDYTKKYGDRDIWSVLPAYFKDMRKKIASSTNSLQHFLDSEKISFSSQLFVPQKVFVSSFMSHCQENNLIRPRGFNEDIYAAPFSNRDIIVKVETVNYRGVNYTNQPVVYGLDVNQILEAEI